MTKDTEKLASNFELNVISLGVHRFQLEKGDKFELRNDMFNYDPQGKNKNKGQYRQYRGRTNTHSAKKYMKDVMRADNIELVLDEPWVPHIPEDKRRHKIWVVNHAYVIPAEEHESLYIQIVEHGNGWADDGDWTYKVEERKIKKITEETIFLEKDCPITYHSKIGKNEMGKATVGRHNGTYFIYSRMEDFDECEMKLMNGIEEMRLKRIASTEQKLKEEKEALEEFAKLKKERGY